MTRSGKRAANESDDEETTERPGAVDWSRVLGAIQPENIAIFADRGIQSVPAAVKKMLPKDVEVILGEPPRGSELVSWMKQRATDAGSTISDMDARLLAGLLCPTTWASRPSNPAYDHPPDLEQFVNEIGKLAMAAFPGAIERSHINEMTAAGQSDRLFPLIDAVIAGEGTAAIRELSTSIGNGDDSGRISAQLFQQAELMAALESAGRVDPVEAGRQLGLSNPNRMHAVSKSLRALRGGAKPFLKTAIETDRQLKSGILRHPADQIYALVDRTLTQSQTRRNDGT